MEVNVTSAVSRRPRVAGVAALALLSLVGVTVFSAGSASARPNKTIKVAYLSFAVANS
ncbi:MAG: hypothetical protein ACXVRZ_16805 [Gaiellaceae bacterium]